MTDLKRALKDMRTWKMTDPIKTIRRRVLNHEFDHAEMNEALDALDQIEGNVLPPLPEFWLLVNLRYSTVNGWFGAVIKHKTGNCHVLGIEGWGPTPRAAVLAALAKIGGEP